MKRLVLGIMILGVIANPLKAVASSDSFAFQVGGEKWRHENIAPDEIIEDTVEVTNDTEYALQFRLVDTENLNESPLYDVMLYSYNNQEFVDLKELTSDWVEVESGETVQLPLKGYMPIELGNDWQGKELTARFHFEGKLLENDSESTVDVTQQGNKVTVKTGDTSDFSMYLLIAAVSLVIITIIGVRRCYIEKRQ